MSRIDRFRQRRSDQGSPRFRLPLLRRFLLVREADVSGASGVGVVADGVLTAAGKAALFWRPGLADASSVGLYESLADLERIHGHGGCTRVDFID